MKILSKNSLFTKSLTLIMAFTFICQNIAFSEHVSSQVVPNYKSDKLLTNLHIPESYGKIEKVNNSGEFSNSTPESPQVVLIRDVHCNYEAQSNIAKILNILINDHKIDMVCIEGADGGVDPSRIAAYCDDSKIRQKVTDKYLRNGLLTASEALSINRGVKPGFTIWGVENLRLYLKDYQAFRRTIETNGETTHFVKLLSYIISHLKKKLYPEKLQKFDFEINKYEINEIPLTNFIKFLSLTKPLIPKEYPTLDLVLRTITLEEKIYFEKVENERSALIKHLEQQLPKDDLRELIQKSLLFKLGKISQADYYSYLEDYYRIYGETAGLPFENLEKYFELVKLQTQIDEKALFKEMEIFRESIYTDFLPDENARQLHQSDKDVNILTKIVNLEATREDFEYYNINRHKFRPEKLLSFIKILARTNNISIPPELEDPAFLGKIDTTLLPPEDFYNLAMERDDAIVENFLNTIKKHEKKAAVLIVGGFHTDGIKMKLLRKGISLIVVTPILTKPQEDSRELYMARIMDERIKPEMILAKMSLENLAPIPVTSDIVRKLGLGLDRIIIDALTELMERKPEELQALKPLLESWYQNAISTNNTSLGDFIKGINDSLPPKHKIKIPEEKIPPQPEEPVKEDEEHIRNLLERLKSATFIEDALASAKELGNIAKSAETPEKEYIAKLAVYSLENIILTSSLVFSKGILEKVTDEILTEDIIEKTRVSTQVLIDIFLKAKTPVANSAITVIGKALESPFLPHDIKTVFEDVLKQNMLKIGFRLQKIMDSGEIDKKAFLYTFKKILHRLIRGAMTEDGMLAQLVFEKLEDMLINKLTQGDYSHKVDLACITLPMKELNAISLEKGDRFRELFYQRVAEFVKEKKEREKEEYIYMAFEETPGQYYGLSRTRLFVIGLNEVDLQEIREKILPDCLEKMAITNTKDYPLYIGHVKVGLEGITPVTRDNITEVNIKEIEEAIIDRIKEATGRAEAAEKKNITFIGENSPELADTDVKNIIKKGRNNFVPINKYTEPGKIGHIPRPDHELRNLERIYTTLEQALGTGENVEEAYLKYLDKLNTLLLQSLQDIRYEKAFKLEYFNAVLEAQADGTLSEYIEWLKGKKLAEIAEQWGQPLLMTKRGDEIWLYLKMQDGQIRVTFIELDGFNAFNKRYIPDASDNFYHQILDSFFTLYSENYGERRITPEEADRFEAGLEENMLNTPIIISDEAPNRDGYIPETEEYTITYKDKTTGEPKTYKIASEKLPSEPSEPSEPSKPIKPIKAGEKRLFRNFLFDYSAKPRIRGKIERPYIGKMLNKAGDVIETFVLYNNRIYKIDKKGNAHDETDSLMNKRISELRSNKCKIVWEIGPPGATVVTDRKSILRRTPYQITRFRKEKEKPISDSAQRITEQVVDAFIEYGIKDIDKGDLSKSIEDAIIKAAGEERGVGINEILDLIEDKITPKELFEIAEIIGKQLNIFLGDEARSKGGRMIASILRRVLAEIPEERRAEGKTRIEELFNTIRKQILKKDGIDTKNPETGITAEELEDGLALIELGFHIIAYDPLLDITQIDASYFDYIIFIAERLGVDRETMAMVFREEYFIKQIELLLLTEKLSDDVRRKIISEIREEKQWTELSDDARKILSRKMPSERYERIQEIVQLMKNGFSGAKKVTLPDSRLFKATARLKLYKQLEGIEKFDVDLDTPKDAKELMGNLDLSKGMVENEIIRLLSTTYTAQLDLEKAYNELLEELQAEPILQKNTPVVESIPASLFGKAKIENGRLKLQLNNVGLTAFFKLMGKLGKNNVFLELQVGNEEELALWEEIHKAMPKDLQGKISIGLEVKNANEALERREKLIEQLTERFGIIVSENNIVIMTGEKFISEGIEKYITEKGLKIFGVANESSLHSVLLFGLFYGLTDEIIVNNKLSDTILEALKLLGMNPAEIEKIKSEGGLFFTVTLIRIADTLKEFQNRKITIDVAA